MVTSISDLARHAEDVDRHLLELFASLEALDPEVATRILDTLGERLDAAHWIIRPVPGLGGLTPVRVLAAGRRQDLLDLLI